MNENYKLHSYEFLKYKVKHSFNNLLLFIFCKKKDFLTKLSFQENKFVPSTVWLTKKRLILNNDKKRLFKL